MTNIVIVVMDTARYDDVLGESSEATTSNIHDIARNGTTFTEAYAAAPWTLPSHASLFTGTYPSRHGAHAGHKRLTEPHPTLATAFSEAGYETVGISNNTWISGEFGFERGFDTFHKTWQYVQSETDLGKAVRTNEGVEKYRAIAKAIFDGNPITNAVNAVYGRFLRKQQDKGATQTNNWIQSWLSDRTDSPFFLFINYLEPHLEYRPPREYATQFLPNDVTYDEAMEISQDAWGYIAGTVDLPDRELELLHALYRAELSYLDDQIGELREHLKAASQWDDTIFMILGDHGENIGDHGLMDHQYSLADTLLHVPLVAHGGPFNNGGKVNTPVQLPDVAPTLLDCGDIDSTNLREAVQGYSFHPASDESRTTVLGEYLAPQPSMDALKQRVGELSEDVRTYDRSLRSIRANGWKLIRGSDGSRQLYQVDEERTDRSSAHPDVVDELEKRLNEWLNSFEHADEDSNVHMTDETRDRLEELGYLQ